MTTYILNFFLVYTIIMKTVNPCRPSLWSGATALILMRRGPFGGAAQHLLCFQAPARPLVSHVKQQAVADVSWNRLQFSPKNSL